MTTWQQTVLAFVLSLIANEFCDVSPWLAKRLVTLAARCAYADESLAPGRAEEWSAVIDERPGKLFKLGTGFLFLAGAVTTASRQAIAREAARRLLSLAETQISSADAGLLSRYAVVHRLLLLMACRLGSVTARALLGQSYEITGDLDAAIEHYSIAFEAGASETWCRLGGLLEMHGQPDAAIGVYQRALAPGGDLARADLIRMLQQQGRIDEALDVHTARQDGAAAPGFVLDSMDGPTTFQRLKEITVEDLAAQRATIRGRWGARIWAAGLLELDGRMADAADICVEDPNDRLAAFQLAHLETMYGVEPDRPLNLVSKKDRARRRREAKRLWRQRLRGPGPSELPSVGGPGPGGLPSVRPTMTSTSATFGP